MLEIEDIDWDNILKSEVKKVTKELKTGPSITEVFTQAKKQGYPQYISEEKDYVCNICGEPWDSFGISHGDMDKREKRLFFQGKGCPCCPKER